MPLNTSTENRFQYNGKELEKDAGIGLSDYGARWYDASIGRFTGGDPLAEKYSFQSPYAYATNNPVLLRDILGLGVENEYVRDFETGELTQVGNKGGDETDYIYSGKIHKDENGNVTHVTYSEADAEVFSVGIVFSPDLAIGSEWSTERVPGAIIQHTSGSDAIQSVDDPFTMMAPGVMKYLEAKVLAYSVETAAAKGGGEVENVFRVYGGKAKSNGFSWTPVDPNNVGNFRNVAGLPNVNTGRFVIEGTVKKSSIIKSRLALPLDGNKGGLLEFIINPKNVKINRVSGANPPF